MSTSNAPIIILVRPQLGENIGMCMRAMMNCGMSRLRLVAPRDGWPSAQAERAASGAYDLMDEITVFDTVEEAIADCHTVFATTAFIITLVSSFAVRGISRGGGWASSAGWPRPWDND